MLVRAAVRSFHQTTVLSQEHWRDHDSGRVQDLIDSLLPASGIKTCGSSKSCGSGKTTVCAGGGRQQSVRPIRRGGQRGHADAGLRGSKVGGKCEVRGNIARGERPSTSSTKAGVDHGIGAGIVVQQMSERDDLFGGHERRRATVARETVQNRYGIAVAVVRANELGGGADYSSIFCRQTRQG